MFVPEPVPPPPLPVKKKPLSLPPRESPVGFWPETTQAIGLPDGNAGVGVQVSIVLPELQTGEVGSVAAVVPSINWASVALVSIASLNVKTTAADGDTPVALFAGTVETMVG